MGNEVCALGPDDSMQFIDSDPEQVMSNYGSDESTNLKVRDSVCTLGKK